MSQVMHVVNLLGTILLLPTRQFRSRHTSDMADVSFLAKQTLWRVTLALAASIKDLHLWNLCCPLNCLNWRFLALHRHWHTDDSTGETL